MWIKAEKSLREAVEIHEKIGTEVQLGFDYLRLAQLNKLSRNAHAALGTRKQLLERATSLLDSDQARFHILLEQASEASENGEPIKALGLAEKALNICLTLRYPRGMADALGIIGDTRLAVVSRTNLIQALDHYVTSIVLYPYPGNAKVANTYETLDYVLKTLDDHPRSRWLKALPERLHGGDEPFGYFTKIAPDRNQPMNDLLLRIQQWTPKSSVLTMATTSQCPRLPARCTICGPMARPRDGAQEVEGCGERHTSRVENALTPYACGKRSSSMPRFQPKRYTLSVSRPVAPASRAHPCAMPRACLVSCLRHSSHKDRPQKMKESAVRGFMVA